jgi:hypothetical protein
MPKPVITPDFGPKDFTDSEFVLWAGGTGIVDAAFQVCAIRGVEFWGLDEERRIAIADAMVSIARERIRWERTEKAKIEQEYSLQSGFIAALQNEIKSLKAKHLADLNNIEEAAEETIRAHELAEQQRDEARRTALAANVVGPWSWMPGGTDGENDLASMSDDMAVTMTAGVLRDLLKKERLRVLYEQHTCEHCEACPNRDDDDERASDTAGDS